MPELNTSNDVRTLITDDPSDAAQWLLRGKLVAFPTETVYGLGADALDAGAVKQIFQAKGRPPDNPLIVHLAALDQLRTVVREVTPAARVLMEQFVPGPLTLILPKRDHIPAVVTAGLDTVGVRWPRHPVAQAFLEACGRPVAAPSANRSGRPSPTTWQAVQADLDGRIACILRGPRSEAGLESTVVDCTGTAPVVLRAGVVTLEQLREVLPTVRLAEDEAAAAPRSPGTRYRHYAPRAQVVLVGDPADAVPDASAGYIGLEAPPEPDAFGLLAVTGSLDRYAHELFDFFRRCDAAGLTTIYCQAVPTTRLGRALMDRLHRAAQG